jgi:hypothetical protein
MKASALRMNREGVVGVYERGGIEPAVGDRLILLVHGFNNDESQAAQSYFAMRSNLDNVLRLHGTDEEQRKNIQSRVWELYWPGYLPLSARGPSGKRRFGYEPALSAASYSLEVVKARTWVADGLATYLRRIRPAEVFFIAHSLGCRVVLETVKRLSSSILTNIQFPGFVLMAGAVPVDSLLQNGSLGPSALSPSRRYCMHSYRDAVLMLAFPPGQLMSAEAPSYGLPVATGLTGWPTSLWSNHTNTKLGHGGYWKEGIFKDKALLSELCAGIFGVAVERNISVTGLLTMPSAQAFSILPERQLATGRLPGSRWLEDKYGPHA